MKIENKLTKKVLSKQSEVNENIIITIRDNGTGIPATIIEQIFNPFFTTKPSGEGTGLGLSISHDIILVHGGDMKVTSEENVFILILTTETRRSRRNTEIC